ncbi:MAG TPA: zinc ABC transporter substrate-binding protein [Bacteroidales bacterium]|nr:zinc ABC transporter substrate-binding protein [Bacteroidales bacterium]
MNIRFSLLLMILGLFLGCSNESNNNKPTVTVSILPQQYFVEKLTGDHFAVNVMIPPGASPVTYEPTPKQMQNLTHSKVYFRIGHIEFEKSWIPNIKDIHPKMKVVDLSENAHLISPQETDHEHHAHDGHHHHGTDPHIWVSPKEVKKQVEIIYQYFIKNYPELDSSITANYQILMNEVEQLDQYATHKLEPFKGEKFLIFHPALSYLARDYGLEQISIEIDGKEPTPSNMQEIIKTARSENIRIVFVQKQFSKHNAEVIAKEIEGTVVQINPLDYHWDKSIRFIVDRIVESYTL